jgi:hypothetical protein
LPTSDPVYEATPAEREAAAEKELTRAIKLEVGGNPEEAIKTYEAIVAHFPETRVAGDAASGAAILKKQLQAQAGQSPEDDK